MAVHLGAVYAMTGTLAFAVKSVEGRTPRSQKEAVPLSISPRRPSSGRPQTMAIHSGDDPFSFFGAAAPGIIQTSTFVFESYEAYAEARHTPGAFLYTRGNNPTVRVAEEKLAALEEAESCRLFGSGMAAIAAAIMSSVRAGDHIISIDTVYGPTQKLLSHYLPRFGVETTFVEGTEVAHFAEAIRPNTRLIFLESPSSFYYKLQDLAGVAAIARARGIRTAIDNSYGTSLLQRPLDLGIDLVVYTVTKFHNGHSDVVAGAVLGSGEQMRRINKEEHPLLGGIIGPFEAWLVARGLRTLPARLRQHQASARQVADFLAADSRIRKLYYVGHPSHPQFELAQRQMQGAGSLISFELETGDIAAVKRFVNALRYFGLGVSWGGHESLIVPYAPASGERVPPLFNLLRIHVGLEDPLDLIDDLKGALDTL